MTNEPENNSEQRLQEYARQRREAAGAPLELHPATRKMLQDEVARTHGAAAADTPAPAVARTSWLASLWPRISFGTAVFATVAFVAFAVFMDGQLKRKSPMQLAYEKSATAYQETVEKEPKPVALRDETKDRDHAVAEQRNRGFAEVNGPALSPPTMKKAEAESALGAASVDAKNKENFGLAGQVTTGKSLGGAAAAAGEKKYLAEADKQVAQPAPVLATESEKLKRAADANIKTKSMDLALAPAAPAPARGLSIVPAAPMGSATRNELPASERRQQDTGALSKSRATIAASVDQLTQAGDRSAGFGGGAQQSFRQVEADVAYRKNLNSPPFPKVMKSFQLEVSGDQVRITDADGSTYDGKITGAPTYVGTLVTNGAEKQQAATFANNFRAGGAPEVAFEVRGTNRTLNKRVVFRGSFAVVNGASGGGGGLGDTRKKESPRGDTQPAMSTPSSQLPTTQLGLQNLQRLQIRGRATVGASQYDLDAEPVR